MSTTRSGLRSRSFAGLLAAMLVASPAVADPGEPRPARRHATDCGALTAAVQQVIARPGHVIPIELRCAALSAAPPPSPEPRADATAGDPAATAGGDAAPAESPPDPIDDLFLTFDFQHRDHAVPIGDPDRQAPAHGAPPASVVVRGYWQAHAPAPATAWTLRTVVTSLHPDR